MEAASTTDRDWRDRRAIVAGVVIGIVLATAYGLLIDTRFVWVPFTPEGIEAIRGLDLRLLVPVLLVGIGLASGWFGHPLMTTGHRRWPFGAREPGIARRRREHVAAWFVAYPLAALAAGLPETVSGVYSAGDGLLLVQAPVDGARATVIALATFVGVYLLVQALIRRLVTSRAVVAAADRAQANGRVD